MSAVPLRSPIEWRTVAPNDWWSLADIAGKPELPLPIAPAVFRELSHRWFRRPAAQVPDEPPKKEPPDIRQRWRAKAKVKESCAECGSVHAKNATHEAHKIIPHTKEIVRPPAGQLSKDDSHPDRCRLCGEDMTVERALPRVIVGKAGARYAENPTDPLAGSTSQTDSTCAACRDEKRGDVVPDMKWLSKGNPPAGWQSAAPKRRNRLRGMAVTQATLKKEVEQSGGTFARHQSTRDDFMRDVIVAYLEEAHVSRKRPTTILREVIKAVRQRWRIKAKQEAEALAGYADSYFERTTVKTKSYKQNR